MTFVNQQGGATASGASSVSTLAVVLGSPVSNGNAVLVVASSASGGPGTGFTVTDNKSNIYTRVDQFLEGDPGFSVETASFYCLNVTNAPQTVTVTYGGLSASFSVITVDVWSGVGTLNQHAFLFNHNPGTGTDAITTGAASTSVDGCLLYGVIRCTNNADPTLTTGTGQTVTIGNSADNLAEYKVQSSAGSVGMTGTSSGGGTRDYNAVYMAFSPADGLMGSMMICL